MEGDLVTEEQVVPWCLDEVLVKPSACNHCGASSLRWGSVCSLIGREQREDRGCACMGEEDQLAPKQIDQNHSKQDNDFLASQTEFTAKDCLESAPASTSCMLRRQVYNITPGLFGAGEPTPGFVCAQ